MNKHEYTKILLMIIRGSFMVIRVEKNINMNIHEYTRIHKNIIDDNSWVICDNSCRERIFMLKNINTNGHELTMNFS